MLGIILLAYIGHKFNDLAKLHQRHRWGHILLGVGAYFLGTVLAGLIMFIVLDTANPATLERVNNIPDYLLNLISVPFGMAASFLTYTFLKRKWEKQTILVNEDILDIEDELL